MGLPDIQWGGQLSSPPSSLLIHYQAIHLHKQPLFPELEVLCPEPAFVPRYTSHPSKQDDKAE